MKMIGFVFAHEIAVCEIHNKPILINQHMKAQKKVEPIRWINTIEIYLLFHHSTNYSAEEVSSRMTQAACLHSIRVDKCSAFLQSSFISISLLVTYSSSTEIAGDVTFQYSWQQRPMSYQNLLEPISWPVQKLFRWQKHWIIRKIVIPVITF